MSFPFLTRSFYVALLYQGVNLSLISMLLFFISLQSFFLASNDLTEVNLTGFRYITVVATFK